MWHQLEFPMNKRLFNGHLIQVYTLFSMILSTWLDDFKLLTVQTIAKFDKIIFQREIFTIWMAINVSNQTIAYLFLKYLNFFLVDFQFFNRNNGNRFDQKETSMAFWKTYNIDMLTYNTYINKRLFRIYDKSMSKRLISPRMLFMTLHWRVFNEESHILRKTSGGLSN